MNRVMPSKRAVFLDRGWLYGVAFIVDKTARGLSAGRVQSVWCVYC